MASVGTEYSTAAEQVADDSKQHRLNSKQHLTDSTQSSLLTGAPSSPIPFFSSSSEPSSSLPSLSPRGSRSVCPPRRRRRKISDLEASEIWKCPLYLCHKRYKKTSIQSIALHKAKCGSRPQLMSQQHEQQHKDMLLQQQSEQLHEQQLMLNMQWEEQRRQLMALQNAWQALLLTQHQQQMMQLPSAAAGSFFNQQPFGLVPSDSPCTSVSHSNQLIAVGSTAHQLPLQHLSSTQTLSYSIPSNPPVDALTPSSSSLVCTLSSTTQSSVVQPIKPSPLTPSKVSGAPRVPSSQQPNGMESL